MIGHTLRIVRAFQSVDYNKKIKGKVTPLLKHLAVMPRWNEEKLNAASEVWKPRKSADESEGTATEVTNTTDESTSEGMEAAV